MIDGDAVFQRVRAAGIRSHVAADRAGALAGRVGRVVKAGPFEGVGQPDVHDAGLHDGVAIAQIDFFDRFHPRENDQHAAVDRQTPSGQASTGTARQVRDVVLVAEPNDGLHVGCVAREADNVGTVLFDRETVALINNHFGVVCQQVVVAQSTSQFGEERWESGCDHGRGIQRAGRRSAGRHGA